MDPLCGWCYGFSPVIVKLQEQYKDTLDFAVIPGGMVTGARVQPVAAISGYILQSYQRVEEYSGAKFGEPYLDMLREGSEINNSEPPCRAIHTFAQLQPQNIIAYTHALQLKQFVDGRSFNDTDTYRELATEFGIDADDFLAQMESEEMRYGTQQEFQWVQAAGISGFPCTVLQKEDKYYLVSRGFQTYEATVEVLEKALK